MATPVHASNPLPYEHTCRTRIYAELATMDRVLALPFTDPTSCSIRDWKKKFLTSIRNVENPTAIVEEYKQSLVDIIGMFAEKTSYLGSDGVVYGKRRLYVVLPERPRGFVVQRDPIVEAAFSWLVDHGIRLKPPADITEMYKKMKKEGTLPELPTDAEKVKRQERIRQIREARIAKEQKLKEAREAAQAAAAGIGVDASLGGIPEKVRASQERWQKRMDEAKKKEAEREAELRAEEERWAKDNEELGRDVDGLEESVRQTTDKVRKSEESVSSLEKSIQETRQAIAERNARDEKNAWETIGKVAACAAIAYGTGMAVSEPSGGGLMVGTTFAI